MITIIIYDKRQKEISQITGEDLFIKIIDGIQCICKDTSNAYFDSYSILYTVPRNFFLEKKVKDENHPKT